MILTLIEPYYTGSHSAWAKGYQKFSRHTVNILSLPGRFWKWRMHGGAVTLAKRFNAERIQTDMILATDMLDLCVFLAHTRELTAKVPIALYFHENQLAYPWSPDDRDLVQKRDAHYGFINYASALAADRIFFNSIYNKSSFIEGVKRLLNHFPDYKELATVGKIREKSIVLPIGLDLSALEKYRCSADSIPLILWNHRWEYDKNPQGFFKALTDVDDRGESFRLALLGENFRNYPEEFSIAGGRYGERVLQYGYASSLSDYAEWLWRSHIVPITSHHDFFGISLVEAMYCECLPLLPDRLAYPEIVPKKRFPELYYATDEELVTKLESLLHLADQTVMRRQMHQLAAEYRWEKMAEQYDEEFEKLVHFATHS